MERTLAEAMLVAQLRRRVLLLTINSRGDSFVLVCPLGARPTQTCGSYKVGYKALTADEQAGRSRGIA